MFTPAIYRKSFFDDLFDFAPISVSNTSDVLRSDIRESDDGYCIDIDMPGVKKDDIRLQLKDSLLTVSAQVNSDRTEGENTRFLRRERFSGSFSRSFTVAENITDEDISARFTDGVLSLFIPKKPQAASAEERYIPIAD